jgi:hypothetical protein
MENIRQFDFTEEKPKTPEEIKNKQEIIEKEYEKRKNKLIEINIKEASDYYSEHLQ